MTQPARTRQGLAHPRPTRGYIVALHDLYPDCR